LDEQGVSYGVVGIGRDITKRKQTEEELRRKTAFLETQVNTSIDGILVVDENNRKILQNQRVNDLLKIPKHIAEDKNDEVQRKWVMQATQKPEKFIARALYLISHPDEIMRDELEMKDGTILDRYTSPLVGRDGKYYGRMWTFRDITERKRAELAAARLASIVQSADAAIIGETLEGIITSWNAAAEKVFGYSAYEILGQPIMRLVPPDRAQEETENLDRIRSGGHVSQLETVWLRQDGSPVDVSIASSAIKDTAGKAVGASKIVRDITEITRTRAEMENLERKEAEHKAVEERSSRALKHERELNQIKSQFVSMVSHEFRTPLCVINAAASLLEDYSAKMTGEERTEQTREIERAVNRMAQMMEDLLVHEKLQTGKMECKPSLLDMEAFCRELILDITRQFGTACLIECAIDPSAREAFLDKRILRHILCNLLSNAVKYSQDNRPVNIELKRVAGHAQTGSDRKIPPGDHIQLLVRDGGIGIPAADLAKLCQSFHRAGNVGNRPGTGMGLAIVKKFVDLHRGTIRFESTIGKGTSVWVWLPIDSSEVGRQPSSVGSESTKVGAAITRESESPRSTEK
jgi:PAS domain S-box-containing protein